MKAKRKKEKNSMKVSMENCPLVSIVVTAHNGGKYLAAQLDSLAEQTCKNTEIIICDDCSADDTKNIIKKFAEKHKHVSYYFNEINLGVNKNFEQGFLKAKGEFICIADQDDIWQPEKIKVQMDMFTSDEILLVHSASARFSCNNLPSKSHVSSYNMFQGNDVRKLLLRNSVSGHNIIFRKNLLPQILPFPTDVYYDWWIVQTAACNGEVAGTAKVLVYQRAHETNVTVKERTTSNQTEKEFSERTLALAAFLRLKGLSLKDKQFIQNLKQQYAHLKKSEYSPDLFKYLMKHREIFFYYKKGLFKYFSQRKAAMHLSRKEKE